MFHSTTVGRSAKYQPAIDVIPRSRLGISGSSANNTATLVSGPIVRSSISLGRARIVSRMNSIASRWPGGAAGTVSVIVAYCGT